MFWSRNCNKARLSGTKGSREQNVKSRSVHAPAFTYFSMILNPIRPGPALYTLI